MQPPSFNSASDLLKAARSYQLAALLLALAELDLVSLLQTFPQGATASALAASLNLHERPLKALLMAAVAANLLQQEADHAGEIRYLATPLSRDCLSRTLEDGRANPHYLGNQLKSYQAQYAGWGHLSDAVRTGQTVLPDLQSSSSDPLALRKVLLGLHTSGQAILAQLLPLLEPYFLDEPAKRLLDIGCGTGVYSLALAEKYAASALLLDKPEVLALAKDLLKDSPAFARLSFQPADYKQSQAFANIGTFDGVLLFQVLRTEAPATRQQLLQQVAQLLTSGGFVAVYDSWLDENKIAPFENVLQNLTMSLMYAEGELFTAAELSATFAQAGLRLEQIHTLAGSTRPMALYVGRKL